MGSSYSLSGKSDPRGARVRLGFAVPFREAFPRLRREVPLGRRAV
jgi:hypothetical protein